MDGTTPETQQPTTQAANPQSVDPNAIRNEVLTEVFGGKYRTVEDAKAGFWNLNNYASQAYQALSDRVNPAQLAQQRNDPFAQIEQDSLVKGDVLRDAIRSEAQLLVRQELAPLQEAWVARQELATSAPDYLANEPAILAWLQKNPQVASKVSRQTQRGLHDLAAETALHYWRTANPPSSTGNVEQKAQAMLPNANVSGPRTMEPSNDRQQQLMQAIAYGHMSGDRRPAYSSVFPDFQVAIPAHLADQFQR